MYDDVFFFANFYPDHINCPSQNINCTKLVGDGDYIFLKVILLL